MYHERFTHSLFMRTNLRHADFAKSGNSAIHILQNNIEGARFSGNVQDFPVASH